MDLSIADSSLRGGCNSLGGAIQCSFKSKLSLRSTNFSHNQAEKGAALYMQGGLDL